MPVFVFKDPLLEGVWWRRYCDPERPYASACQERVPKGEPHAGPEDGLFGSGAVEIVLSRLLPPAAEAPPG
ncbi:MAG: hypothetical protein LBK95_01710 [Bifidobacteriaceae bacterium]|jgi:hypothetical protein|nr:hypothetical protein [Bifidobacteriaceae bacterium]